MRRSNHLAAQGYVRLASRFAVQAARALGDIPHRLEPTGWHRLAHPPTRLELWVHARHLRLAAQEANSRRIRAAALRALLAEADPEEKAR